MAKKPWIAALLNIILPGSGYLYNGKRKFFGSLVAAGYLLTYYIELSTDPTLSERLSSPLMFVAGVILGVAFAYDAYEEAQELSVSQ